MLDSLDDGEGQDTSHQSLLSSPEMDWDHRRHLTSGRSDVMMAVGQAPWHLHVAPHAATRPLVVAGHQHVLDHRLDGHLAHHPHEEELLYHGGGHRPQGGQPQQQLAEPGGLVGVVSPAVFLQRTLRLFLKALDDLRWRQSDSVWKYQNSIKNASENLNKIWRMWR